VSYRLSLSRLAACALVLALASCGGGGGGGTVTNPNQPIPQDTVASGGPNSFLIFPNPVMSEDGTFETASSDYAAAYYRAIDPMNQRTTLEAWKTVNGFGTPSMMGGDIQVIFGDMWDLGYGRLMTFRMNNNGTVAAFVQNYVVNAGDGYTYSSLNLDAALVPGGDPRWHIGTNAIEYSPGPGGVPGVDGSFTKFYTFNPTTGQRLLLASLDNRTPKGMPSVCINCHGGRGDPLTPPSPVAGPFGVDLGQQLFPLVANSVSQRRGDTQARMHMINVNHLDFSTTVNLRTRAAQEAAFKMINQIILCTYPRPSGVAATGVDACRPAAGANEWQGTSAMTIKAAYGLDADANDDGFEDQVNGNSLPSATFLTTFSNYLPSGWIGQGQDLLYTQVAESVCMTCHMQRGTANQSDIDFQSYDKFLGYKERIKAHVFDRGNMPLAKIVADRLFGSSLANQLATWLTNVAGINAFASPGVVLLPGRPIADPGPDRVMRPGSMTLSGANSLFSTSYSWSITFNAGNGSLTNPNSVTPVFNATVPGLYQLQLIASSGGVQSTPVIVKINVMNGLPATVTFADIRGVLQTDCVACHDPADGRPPIFYSANLDRDGDGVPGPGDPDDDVWLYREVRGRINFTEIVASPLLRKPSGNHHNGLQRPGFNTALDVGNGMRNNYDLFVRWILLGAPYN
jgi:hypothetical protein